MTDPQTPRPGDFATNAANILMVELQARWPERGRKAMRDTVAKALLEIEQQARATPVVSSAQEPETTAAAEEALAAHEMLRVAMVSVTRACHHQHHPARQWELCDVDPCPVARRALYRAAKVRELGILPVPPPSGEPPATPEPSLIGALALLEKDAHWHGTGPYGDRLLGAIADLRAALPTPLEPESARPTEPEA